MTPHDLDTAARTIWGEARGEDFMGRVAVAHVILNRAFNPGWWGRDVSGVCLKPWQFSCWNANDPNRMQLERLSTSDPLYQECAGIMSLAWAARRGRNGIPGVVGVDPTHGATHYMTNALFERDPPKWAEGQTPHLRIGNHAFFKDVG